MRNFITVALILFFAATAFAADEKPSPYSVYTSDKNPDNFVKAYRHYVELSEDSLDYNSTAMVVYLVMHEMERNLGMLEENRSELKNRTKFLYANALLELGRYEGAISLYEDLNKNAPKWSCPWRHKGEAYWKSGDLEAAVEALEMAIETRETHYDAYVMLAEVLRDREEYKKALETLEKGLGYYGKDIEDPEEEVSSVDVYFLYMDLLKKNGKQETELFRNLYEKARKAAPEDERLDECEILE
ncbi:MAG: tetratricopeptide repeat protein [Candidatus Krumholzibacteriales bacterium]